MNVVDSKPKIQARASAWNVEVATRFDLLERKSNRQNVPHILSSCAVHNNVRNPFWEYFPEFANALSERLMSLQGGGIGTYCSGV